MATITMDTSEYEALQKNIKLLEEAKKREEELNDQVKKLQEEKIQALENAEKSVSKITRIIEVKRVILKRDVHEIFDNLSKIINSRHLSSYNRYGDVDLTQKLIESFFEFKTTESIKDFSVITKGFEEVRAEMEQKYFEELSLDTKKELKKIESLIEENKVLTKSNFDLENKNLELEDYKEKLKRSEEESKKNFKLFLSADGKVDSVKSILKMNWNILNYNTIKSRIEVAVKTEKE